MGQALVRGVGGQSLGVPLSLPLLGFLHYFQTPQVLSFSFLGLRARKSTTLPMCPVSAVCAMDCHRPRLKSSDAGGKFAVSHPWSTSTLCSRSSCIYSLFVCRAASLVFVQSFGLWRSCCLPHTVQGSLRDTETQLGIPLWLLPSWYCSIPFSTCAFPALLLRFPRPENEEFFPRSLSSTHSKLQGLCLALG